MADPLSMSASILGLVGAAHAVIDKLVTYVKSVKGAEKEVKALLVKVSSLSGIADGLHTLVKTMESQEFEKMMRAEHIYFCQKTLEEIGHQLDKANPPEAGNKLESVKRKM
jgi:Fungal N-terminal domain of STAND proteins